ncbi:hypothetical protein SAMN05518682_0012 [Cellulosimicrobium aquatile]|uniref:Beta-ketoacyl synthase, N-terminal domain n=1 Tax=Cellulosimicrobium aquatile TaxID=1612203 RepID=A0A1N6WB03_9MICO|nr:hypothetical protein [Cellulosimicrobium aquatile]SIQ87135.1 hypothetical protein SAMN05518682_0012 [Cellulosimicrobium aquatile]
MSGPREDALRVRAVVDVPVDDLAPVGDGTRRSVAEDLRYVYGEDQPTDWLEDGPGRDYPTMIRAARAALGGRGLLDDVRLVVLVVTTPDLQHERLLGGFVADLFDGGPSTFCVTEQGLAGPFTALRLAGELLADGGPGVGPAGRPGDAGRAGTAVVLVLEQCTLPPTATRVPARDRVVALVVARDGAGRPVEELTVARAARGPRPAGPTAPAGSSDAPRGARPDVRRVVLGVDVDPADVPLLDSDVVRHADPGAAATGVWEVLADDDAPDAPVVLHERCVELGYRCSLALGPRSAATAPEAGGRAREAVLA